MDQPKRNPTLTVTSTGKILSTASGWVHRHAGEITERFERLIGMFTLRVWPSGEWSVLVAGRMIKQDFAKLDGVDQAKCLAEVYVEKAYRDMSRDLGLPF